MSALTHAADLAETPVANRFGALRLAAAVGFVLVATAFTVHSFILSTQPWEPVSGLEMGFKAAQEETFLPSAESSSSCEAIELTQVEPSCMDCQVELPLLKCGALDACQSEG